MRQLLAWVLVALAVTWGTAILAAPLVQGAPAGSLAPRLSGLSYLIGSLVCHQRPERSFHLAGAQLPVCARCAALYWAGGIGLAGWLLARSRGIPRTAGRGLGRNGRAVRGWIAGSIFALGLPIAITVATSALGVWDPPNALRAISSAPFGVALGAVLAAVVLGDLR